MNQKVLIFGILSLIFIFSGLFITYNSQPSEIIYLQENFSYQLHSNSSINVNLDISVVQNEYNQLIFNFNVMNQIPEATYIQLNVTYNGGPGVEYTSFDLITAKQVVADNILSSHNFVQYNIYILEGDGFNVIPVVIKEEHQLLDMSDIPFYLTKFLFPVGLFVFFKFTGNIEGNKDVNGEENYQYLKIKNEIIGLIIFGAFFFIFSQLFGVFLLIIALGFLLSNISKYFAELDADSYIIVVVLTAIITTYSKLSLGFSLLSQKLKYLEVTFFGCPYLHLIFIVIAYLLIYDITNSKNPKKNLPMVYIHLILIQILTIFVSRIF